MGDAIRIQSEEFSSSKPTLHTIPGGKSIEELTRELVTNLDPNPERPGLKDTPTRFAKALTELTSGYYMDIEECVGKAVYEQEDADIVLLRDIEFYSLCEHHVLPFFGTVHIAYVPGDKIIGLSKMPRIVEIFSKRLQVQERLTAQIANAINDLLEPEGVIVHIEAEHMCMKMRGVREQGSNLITQTTLGSFKSDSELRTTFLQMISEKHS